jgi:2-polyprenyl-6-methoxyphenol hydroxylase-like FAD-dependent oxidoreductase
MHGERAVVLGGSIGGLFAARVLADHFDSVTVIERDRLADTADVRKGVPQARHVHSIWTPALSYLEGLLPGLTDGLKAAGAVEADAGRDFHWWHAGGFRVRPDVGVGLLIQSRALFELHVRRRVRTHARIEVRDETDVLGLTVESGRVTGARVKPRAGEEQVLPATLVVDATGRHTPAPRWLAEAALAAPSETELAVDIAYVSRRFRRRPDDMNRFRVLLISPVGPKERRIAVLFPIEGDQWCATLAGWLGDHPPLDEQGWLGFARDMPTPAFHDFVAALEPAGEMSQYRFASNLRRHYEKLPQPAEGFVALGDALCSFNPCYGQGMSVAAFEARELEHALRDGLDRLPKRYFARAARIVDQSWALSAGEDLRHPEVKGPRPTGSSFINAYVERLHRASHSQPEVHRAMVEVFSLHRPLTTLLTPRMALRALRAPRP